MNEPIKRMTVMEFLDWTMRQPGRYELIEGLPVKMPAERLRHVRAKLKTVIALIDAVKKAGADCEVLTDGVAVAVGDRTVFEPDAVVYCGERLDGDALLLPNPVIVVEVISPSSEATDTGRKLAGYFRLESVRHYLVIEPEDGFVTHHERFGDGRIETRIFERTGQLTLDPPGLKVAVADFLP